MMDWTFDMFVEDAKLYRATPMKGVHCSSSASYRESFMTWFKNCERDFRAKWLAEHNNHFYDRYDGWIGDAFANELDKMCFSDFYKDTYNQRPHLPRWYYIHMLGLPSIEDHRTFCSTPIDDAVEQARRVRENFENM